MRKFWRIIWAPIGRRLEIGRAPGGKYWCCENEENLEFMGESASADMTTTAMVCAKCERRHFTAHVRPKRFTIQGSSVG